jgi:hypothetical protein
MRESLIALVVLATAACNTTSEHRFNVTRFEQASLLGHGLDALDLGVARAVVEDDELRLEGRDKSGQPWAAKAPLVLGAIGRNEILAADFDANGARDLLVVTVTAGMGHCVNHTDVTSLLFDEAGRPLPWTVHADVDNAGDLPLVDRNSDGHAELVAMECDWYNRNSDGDILKTPVITYEAREGRWIPLQATK